MIDTGSTDEYISPMDTDNAVIARCPACGAKNRVPISRWGDPKSVCGKCKAPLRPAALFPDRPVRISDAVFAREVLDFEGPVLAEFFSPHCGHCVRLAPVIDELAATYAGRVKFVLIDIEHERTIAAQQSIEGTPTILFYKRGRLVDRVVGALPKEELARRIDSAAAA